VFTSLCVCVYLYMCMSDMGANNKRRNASCHLRPTHRKSCSALSLSYYWCCIVLKCVAACCSVLQCVAVCVAAPKMLTRAFVVLLLVV